MITNILLYSLVSFFFFILASKISYKLELIDIPSARKIHIKPTAYTGGIILSFIYLTSIIIFKDYVEGVDIILSAAFLIAIVGLIDDRYHLNIGGKLSLQIIPVIYLILKKNFKINSLGNYNYFILNLNSFSISFTIISIVFLINSFNYFDGLDGTLGFTTLTILGILYFLVPNGNIQIFFIIIFIPLLIFLFFNFSIFKLPKLFLGDSGSLFFGFIIGFILVYLENKKIVHPILLAWSIAIFAFEFIAINLLRLKNNKHIFVAGLDHLHHLIFKNNNSIFLTNLYICMLNVIFFIIGYLSFHLISPLASLIFFIISFVIFLYLRNIYFLKN
mgnify:CR=1 FL=1